MLRCVFKLNASLSRLLLFAMTPTCPGLLSGSLRLRWRLLHTAVLPRLELATHSSACEGKSDVLSLFSKKCKAHKKHQLLTTITTTRVRPPNSPRHTPTSPLLPPLYDYTSTTTLAPATTSGNDLRRELTVKVRSRRRLVARCTSCASAAVVLVVGRSRKESARLRTFRRSQPSAGSKS